MQQTPSSSKSIRWLGTRSGMACGMPAALAPCLLGFLAEHTLLDLHRQAKQGCMHATPVMPAAARRLSLARNSTCSAPAPICMSCIPRLETRLRQRKRMLQLATPSPIPIHDHRAASFVTCRRKSGAGDLANVLGLVLQFFSDRQLSSPHSCSCVHHQPCPCGNQRSTRAHLSTC